MKAKSGEAEVVPKVSRPPQTGSGFGSVKVERTGRGLRHTAPSVIMQGESAANGDLEDPTDKTAFSELCGIFVEIIQTAWKAEVKPKRKLWCRETQSGKDWIMGESRDHEKGSPTEGFAGEKRTLYAGMLLVCQLALQLRGVCFCEGHTKVKSHLPPRLMERIVQSDLSRGIPFSSFPQATTNVKAISDPRIPLY